MSDSLIDPETPDTDAEAKTERRKRDPGLLAIQQIAWELDEFSPEMRKFALGWLNAKYGAEA